MPIALLRELSGVQPRTKEARQHADTDVGYQRSHEDDRLTKIGRYVEYGYPLSSAPSLKAEAHKELINPGWLPTAILVNVLSADQTRVRGSKTLTVDPQHVVKIAKNESGIIIDLPVDVQFDSQAKLAPLEIIDGQHRLLSVDEIDGLPDDYEVPVVLFDNLPLVWQAYLFWVINVEPKKINTSLAFDLYPELRNQDWLEKGESIKIYQEHRAQELVEVLWKHPDSPWRDRIELFGKRVDGHVSNAAAIRSLSATFVRAWPKRREDEDEFRRLGGLFGSVSKGGDQSYVIGWKRSQQAAFLIASWNAVQSAVTASRVPWAHALRHQEKTTQHDPAFSGGFSLLATDQGFRCISFVYNAIPQVQHEQLRLADWYSNVDSTPSMSAVSACLGELNQQKHIVEFLREIADNLINKMDWRTSSSPTLEVPQQQIQAQYRGSSGYTALNKAALRALKHSDSQSVREAATKTAQIVGWDDV